MSYVGIGNRQDYIADFPTQSLNGDGSTTTFTLNFEAVTGSVRVAVDNVLQPADGTAYYTNGNSITFTSAPATGTANITVTYLGTVRNVSSVSDGAITTAKLADLSVTNDKLAGSIATSKLADGSTFATTNGITMADHWRLTSNFTGSGTGDLTANLARVNHDSFSPIGSGMTESSGVFTFPSTGMYLIMAHGDFLTTGSSSGFSSIYIRTTTDNSTYNNRAISWTSIFTAGVYGQSDNNQLFNVTNTSTHKVKFGYELNNSQTVEGSTSNIRTHFIFIRLGDSQ